MKSLPIELATVSPGPDFTKLEMGTRPDGLRDGVHCGGVWLSPDNEAWKPLDARPHRGATERYPTQEAECLAEMTGKPGFPANWRVEEQNGRRWLVRPKCYLWPQDKEWMLRDPPYQLVEEALFALNETGWEYNDLPQLAYDPIVQEWFLLDCSAAHKPEGWRQNWHGDYSRMIKWLGLMGQAVELRQRGRHRIYHAVQLPGFSRADEEPYNVLDVFYPLSEDERRTYVYVYASCNRPMSRVWAKMDGVRYLDADRGKCPLVHTWVVSNHLLDEETIRRYELTFAYRPWP